MRPQAPCLSMSDESCARDLPGLASDDLASEVGPVNDNLPLAQPTDHATPLPPPAPLSRENIVIQEVIARAPKDRPARDTVDAIAEWLVGPARHIVTGVASFGEFAWRLLAPGLPLLRVTLHVGTIHPQFRGTTMVW